MQLPCKCHLLWALDSTADIAMEDGTLHSQDDRGKFHLMPFLLKDLAERSVLQNLGLVLVFISCIRYISNLQYCYLLSTNHVLKQGLLTASFAFLWRSTVYVAKIICGEVHYHDVSSHLEPVFWGSDTK